MATPNKDPKHYIIFRKGSAPLQLTSVVDLIQQWTDAIQERSKKGEWWKPIVFKDEEGEDSIALVCEDIRGIVRGAMPQPKQDSPGGPPPPPHAEAVAALKGAH